MVSVTHTKDRQAAALRECGLTEMAERAEKGWYHDYLSPLDTPCITFVDDLAVAASKADVNMRPKVLALRQAVMNGEYDATADEGEEWAASPEGQEAMRLLTEKK